MEHKSQFIGEVEARYLVGPWWRMLSPFGFYSAKYDVTVIIPTGFVTDFSSVPRFPGAYWFAGGTGNRKSLPHDLGYRWFEERHMFDVIFHEAGVVEDKMQPSQNIAYKAFRWLRNGTMTGTVMALGWAVKATIPGCLDYRERETCGRNCVDCPNFYPGWFLCKEEGFHPELLEMHR